MTIFERTWERLRNKKYREHYVDGQLKRAVPFQIRSIMKARGLSQADLAQLAGLTQGVVSRAASPKYGNLTLNTIIRVAAGLDVAFIGRFVPFSELVHHYEQLSETMGDLPTFDEEYEALAKAPTHPIAGEGSSALREASIGAQAGSRVETLFRLTSPRLNRQAGAVLDFDKRRPARSSAAELKAVSQ